ncbi:Uncharacterised protein [Klebsiella variicola]|nr:hypothetical protein DMS07_28675 [Klebsiella variicola]CEP33642.1 hypothetical protein KV8917_980002 [Klebsiella variicola]SLV35909.1 Uncharacterised protein [Klebsiella variicola]SLW89127.1 Uncharacterised protein [Klebsiella variicola]SLY52232.1 Uncharacterised protein [Klebsiella variicola]
MKCIDVNNINYIKLTNCNEDEIIIKISEINMIIAKGNICIISINNIPTPINIKNKISEIESILNLTQRVVMPCKM